MPMKMARRGWWSVLALCVAGCASDKGASRGSSTEQRAQELEARNAQMQEDIRRQEAELQRSFQALTQAEAAAGLNNLACVGVAPASAQVPGLPRSGAVHAQFQVRGQAYRMTATFSAPRNAGGWRLSQGTCRVGP